MLNLKRFFIILSAMLMMLVFINSITYASDGQINIINPNVNATTAPTTNPTTSPTISPNLVTIQTPISTTTQTPIATAKFEKLPQTGIEDYTGLIIVTIILAASSVFAYKKIKSFDRY